MLNEEVLSEGADGVGGREEEVGVEGAADPEGGHPQHVVEVVEGNGSKSAGGDGVAVKHLVSPSIEVVGIVQLHCRHINDEYVNLNPLEVGVAGDVEVERGGVGHCGRDEVGVLVGSGHAEGHDEGDHHGVGDIGDCLCDGEGGDVGESCSVVEEGGGIEGVGVEVGVGPLHQVDPHVKVVQQDEGVGGGQVQGRSEKGCPDVGREDGAGVVYGVGGN